MSRKPREPKRKRLAPVEPPKPLIQVMPMARGRLDPSCIRELTAWVVAYAQRYVGPATRTLRGLKGDERKRVLGERKAAEAAYDTLFLFAAGLTDTVDLRLIDRALATWDAATQPPPEPVILPFTPPLPGTT